MRALVCAAVLLATLATGGCSSDETPPPAGFCAAMDRLHRATVTMTQQMQGASPEEMGQATAQFVAANRQDIDLVRDHAPAEIKDDTELVYGKLVSGQPVAPEDVPAVQASDQDIQKYVEDHCGS